jgi:hypothetical protein
VLYCNNPVQNIGKLIEGSIPVLYYEIHNESDEICTVEAWTSCGCSTPIIPSNKIPARGHTTLKLQFDTMGKKGINEKGFGVRYKDNGVDTKLVLKFVAEVVK